MMACTKSEKGKYQQVIRRIAGLLAVLLAYMLLATTLHQMTVHASTASHTTLTAPIRAMGKGANVSASHHDTDCALCEWIATPVQLSSAVVAALVVALSTIAALKLAVRVAALCAAPKPRLGLRAPPALTLA